MISKTFLKFIFFIISQNYFYRSLSEDNIEGSTLEQITNHVFQRIDKKNHFKCKLWYLLTLICVNGD